MSQNLIQEINRLNQEIANLKEHLKELDGDYVDATTKLFYLIEDYDRAHQEIATLTKDLANANRGRRVSMASTRAQNYNTWADNALI